MTVHQTDVAVIGAGPVGLFAVFELGMVGLRCHVIDALSAVGGQCVALYPEKPIYDIPGYPMVEAQQLIDRLAEQAAPFEPVYHLGAPVTGLEELPTGRWALTTAAGARVEAGAVIIAAGVGAFGPNRPPLAGIADYEGRSVFYLVDRREAFRDKRVVIAGGGDSAVDWAISLAEIAASVAVVHRRDKFRAAPESERRLRALAADGQIEMVVPYQLAGLEGAGGQLSAVVVQTLKGETRSVPADVLLPFFGLSMDLGPIAEWGLALEHKHIAVDAATCATSRPGLFAVGDIATYPGKLKLILTGFSEAAMAAHAIHPLLRPDEILHFEYSTTKGVPG
ncbi:MAG: NAD(P)/FAD-dependent oxidoreductase [Alphaproteobacteria bacterium]|nr:NAD(P)/FAD-dependent oxidoreductase [Alphaproteobacteria bacterium]